MIINKSKDKRVAKEFLVCTSFLSKLKGLMFSRQKNIIFAFEKERLVALHMWFVFFPIDVVYLDAKKRVVEIIEGFLPFGYYSPKNKAKYVLELKKGSVRKGDIEIGDVIEF